MKNEKILIVDDDAFMREILTEILEISHFNVVAAKDGEEALEILYSTHDFELIITDIHMPKMGGLELINRLKESKITIPIIILTGDKDISNAIEAIKYGASSFLLKDENIDETITISVQQALEKKRLQIENNKLLKNLSRANKDLEKVVHDLTEIGKELSAKNNLETLLEMIISNSLKITTADSAWLCLLEDGRLNFKIAHCQSLNIHLIEQPEHPIDFPFASLDLNDSNIAGLIALQKITVNIPNVYENNLFNIDLIKNFDQKFGYKTKSLLAVPLLNHEDDVIGVLHLFNAMNATTGEIFPFRKRSERFAESISSQAAVAITKLNLIHDMERLFEAFVDVMATAIDEKSPVTGGHIRRVANLTMTMAHVINEQKEGKFQKINFNSDEMYELKMAGLMHDIGKVTTPVEIVEKGKKLQTIFDRVEFIDLRLQYIIQKKKSENYLQKITLMEKGSSTEEIKKLDEETKNQLDELEEIRLFLVKCNEPGEFLADEKIERLKDIAKMTFIDDSGQEQTLLREDELMNLCIRKGSITEAERKKMQAHAAMTIKMLKQIPFTKKLQGIPNFAGAHHEFINGKGYPLGLKDDEIPIQGKLMAVTDIVEALTASDRPYKKSMPLRQVYIILRDMAQKDELDSDMVDLFINENVYEKYREKYESDS